MSFVHLHVHSEYSITDGLPKIPDLIASAAKQGFTAIALTDRHNLFAGIKFYSAALKKGIKPIIGCEVSLNAEFANVTEDCSIVLLCMNKTGYYNLLQLLTQSYLKSEQGKPRVTYESLRQYNEGLLVLSGGCRGDLARYWDINRQNAVAEALTFWKTHFPGRYYLEIFRTGREHEETYAKLAVQCALQNGLPLVATNDVRFLTEEQFEVHEAKVCIANGQLLADEARTRDYSSEQYLKNEAEMSGLFADIPQALENADEIAKRCTVELETDKVLLPHFPLPEGVDANRYLRDEAEKSLRRPGTVQADIPLENYHQRLDHELGVISTMDYAGYFLIVADIVQWAKQQGIPVGPGRGSGAGSLVAYLMGITEIDPLRYDLMFERFLNPDRISMPDIDIDLCMEQRDRVIDYVAQRYGRDKVSQIITFGSMAARAVVRDVGRIQGQPYMFVDQLAKLVPFAVNMTLEKALEESPELRERYDKETDVAAIINTGRALEGLARNPGRHAGGVVIAPRPLIEYTALYCEPGEHDAPLTQCDMKDLEKIGLVKFDFLGLKTLTVIDRTVRYVNKTVNEQINITDLPLDDSKAFDLLRRAHTKSVFQLESEGIRALLRKLRPDKFEDLVAMVALYRPGPLKAKLVDDYIDRKHGRKTVEYPHPRLEELLKSTYGVIVYQEQVMQVAQKLCSYSTSRADLLRRAMGKKLKSEMEKQRENFVAGAEKNEIPYRTANDLFEKIKYFAGYAFNRSHSVAYALVAYRTAWLKAHYPSAFMAAVLSTEMRFIEKTVESVYECQQMGITIIPPNINASAWEFEVVDNHTIRYGFGAIRHMGLGATNEIIAEREANGPFVSLQDFCVRMVPRRMKRSTLQALLAAGAMDTFGDSRACLIASMNAALTFANQYTADSESGQSNLFGEDENVRKMELPTIANEELKSNKELLKLEKESLGFYLTDHPMKDVHEEVKRIIGDKPYDKYQGIREGETWFAGVLAEVSKKRIGAILILDDGEHRFEFGVFGNTYNTYKDIFKTDEILFVNAKNRYDRIREAHSWRINEVLNMEQAQAKFAKSIRMEIESSTATPGFVSELRESIKPYVVKDGCAIRISLQNQNASADLVLGADWQVRLCNQMLSKLRDIDEVTNLTVVY